MGLSKILILFLAILGTPLFVVISALALLSFYSIEIDLSVVIIEMSRLSDTPLLLSLPLFIFAGTLLAESGTPHRLLRLSQVLLGWMPGGLAVVSLMVCAVFTAFTGASGVTIFAIGGLLYPALIKDNYSERFSLGLITSSGSLGLLFPPSLPLILYGVISETRIDQLFLAGIVEKSGAFSKQQHSGRYRRNPETEMKEFVLAWAEETSIGKDIVITQQDVRHIQLAKASIYTGCKLMMRKMGVDRVDSVKIAGAFGSHVDCKLALVMGMFPDCAIDHIRSVGNAAGDGCRAALLNVKKRVEANWCSRNVEYIELTVESTFQQEFMEVISFDDIDILGILFLMVIILGIVLNWISTYFAINKYLS